MNYSIEDLFEDNFQEWIDKNFQRLGGSNLGMYLANGTEDLIAPLEVCYDTYLNLKKKKEQIYDKYWMITYAFHHPITTYINESPQNFIIRLKNTHNAHPIILVCHEIDEKSYRELVQENKNTLQYKYTIV